MKVAKGLLVLAVLGFFGCADAGSPEAVTVKFVKALSGLDFKAAAELGTEDAKKNLSMMESFMTMAQAQDAAPVLEDNATEEQKTAHAQALKAYEDNKKEMDAKKAEAANAEVKIISSKIDGDTAKVEYKVITAKKDDSEPASDETQTVELMKVDGKWKVDLKKDS